MGDQSMPTDLSASQQRLLHNKIHVADGAYAASGRGVQGRFASGWSAALHVAQLLGGLPDAALGWWAEQPGGHLLLTSGDDGYRAALAVDEELRQGVACLPLAWVIEGNREGLAAALRPLDHLLGCAGAEGHWLSEGGGITPRWARIGGQIAGLFRLGYGESPASRQNAHAYLAEGLALALINRRRLNVNDPKLERLLFASLLSEGFWQHFLAEERGQGRAD